VSGAGKAEKVADRILARYPLLVMGREILVESSLVGRHQLRNIALAIAAAEELQKQGFPVTAESIEQGIRATRWPGRFQIIPVTDNQPEFVFDVAHNPAGAWALRSTLSTFYEGRRIILVFGAMRDKAIGEISEILFSLADLVIATSADNPRSATPEEIREAAVRTQADMELINDVKCAVERAKSLASSDENARSTRATLTTKSAQRVNDAVVVITGSIYVVGEAMRALGVDVNAK
jgi:dihydrofolate synthase/folylpolyglutamate synthase